MQVIEFLIHLSRAKQVSTSNPSTRAGRHAGTFHLCIGPIDLHSSGLVDGVDDAPVRVVVGGLFPVVAGISGAADVCGPYSLREDW